MIGAILFGLVCSGWEYWYICCWLGYDKRLVEQGGCHGMVYRKKLQYVGWILAGLMASLLVFWIRRQSEAVWVDWYQNMAVMNWLVVIGIVDWKEQKIPGFLLLLGVLLWGICILVLIGIEMRTGHVVWRSMWKEVFWPSMTGGVVVGGTLWGIASLWKHALGMGDVKLFTVLGLLYGLTDTCLLLFFTMLLMAVVCLFLLSRKQVTGKTTIPLAPFLAVGFLLTVYLGRG
ncbi:MAG: prepilin peptidase [Lachnospiraceae bacterium]|nr:prepilin peptidase [Lachnospiraceae bacterium]